MITKFTEDHEYVIIDHDTATIGITRHAAEQLGDVVFVELPDVGRKVTAAEAVSVVESVKAASDVFSPVSGEVIEVNEALPGNPALVNEDPQGKAWFFKVKISDQSQVGKLLDEETYNKLIQDA
ncbi:MAG: glycine cleavage system protein GcvH [Hyphomicrobiaceae bacterium]